MRLHREEDVEIARRPAAQAGLAFVGQPDARAVLDARRNVDRQRFFLSPPGPAGALGAGVDRRAAPVAGRAGALDGEEALALARTLPWPWHMAQVTGCVPGLAPDPEHSVQAMDAGTRICAVLPAKASSSVISIL